MPCPGPNGNWMPVAVRLDRPESTMHWAYGVTTVPGRRDTLLPSTLKSLAAAGFDKPRLFVDGATNREAIWWEDTYGLEVTTHWPKLNVFGNWALSLGELYLREPTADRFAIFQDDLITYKNLRYYLERCKYPEAGYWNLYTFPENQRLVKRIGQTARHEKGWLLSNQRGLGALALIFNRDTVMKLLGHRSFVDRPQDPKRGWRSVDGGIVNTLKEYGYREFFHNPTLVQHTGVKSSFDKNKHSTGNDKVFHESSWPNSSFAVSFRGEDFDALQLLKED